jgi:hypothetical protein
MAGAGAIYSFRGNMNTYILLASGFHPVMNLTVPSFFIDDVARLGYMNLVRNAWLFYP